MTEHCVICGKKRSDQEKFCVGCGKPFKKKHYKFYLTLFFIIILILAISGWLYYYNSDLTKKQDEYNKNIENLKKSNEESDTQFKKGLEEERNQQDLTIQAINEADKDGDGLSYQQELSMNTDDNNPDSDADGINDNEDTHPAGGGENYIKTVYWTHNNKQYTTQFGIAEDWYNYYRNQKRGYCCTGWEKFATPNDITIKTIAKDISDVSVSTGESCGACIAIDFVESMTYQYDIDYNNNPEYPKYPIETIIDERGDCEDTSFLMASILEALGIDSILLFYSDHAAVGVACNSCTGTYYLYKNKKFYFLETTGKSGSWKIGQIWGKYGSENPKIVDI